MKYCCGNQQRSGTDYLEFQPGRFAHEFWLEDSIYLSAELFDHFKLRRLFATTIPGFDYYGITYVTRDDWDALSRAAENTAAKPVFDELSLWLKEHIQTDDVITILGI